MSEAYDYAVMLLESIVKKHYSPVEGFAPFDRPDVVGVLTQIDNAVAGISQQLAEARAEIETLKINTRCDLDLLAADTVQMNKMQDEIEAIVFVKKKAVEEIAFLNQEIERKDKLIEQMREALNLMLEGAIHDFHYVCQHRDNCLCWGCQKVRVKAALSAAERGE
jgi:hypothetical protein